MDLHRLPVLHRIDLTPIEQAAFTTWGDIDQLPKFYAGVAEVCQSRSLPLPERYAASVQVPDSPTSVEGCTLTISQV